MFSRSVPQEGSMANSLLMWRNSKDCEDQAAQFLKTGVIPEPVTVQLWDHPIPFLQKTDANN
jgi:hypothetical protein